LSLNKSKDIKVMRKFDVDLEFGKQWEEHIDEMFSGAKTCEIKTERDKWSSTGNICIEIESYGKPSGLTSTEAELWVHNLVKDGELCCSLVFNTDKLRAVMDDMKPYTVMGGDNRASKMHLVSIAKLLKAVSQ
tara:strand:+ start:412 stop:810 length:399 start_codon:yes stop_codon:yes gene_type:complete